MKSYFIKSHDGEKIFLRVWDEVNNPIGTVQIVHGMGEHTGRYNNIATYLNSKGFIVYGDDHRGHGETAGTVDKIGYIGKDGFNKIVEDEKHITSIIKKKYPNIPNFICAHSFGSFITQEYLNRYSNEIDGVILCGSAMEKGFWNIIGRIVSTTQMIFGLEKKRDYFIDNIAGNKFNKKENEGCNNSWLTSDENEIKKMEKDKFCNNVFTVNFYYYMFKGFKSLYKKDKNKNIRKDIPIFIIAGGADPVGEYGEAVKELGSYYKSLGLKNISIKIYDGKKHELFNELDREIIYDDIFMWLKKVSYNLTKEEKYISQ